MRRDPGGIAAGRRAVGETVRAVPGADHQEPPVQLPAARREPLRRRPARPNEITYSEDWLRPDYIPPQPLRRSPPPSPARAAARRTRRHRRRPRVRRWRQRRHVTPNPADGLHGLMCRPEVASDAPCGAGHSWLWPWLSCSAVRAVRLCGWRGLNSLPLPGTEGGGPARSRIQAQLPDVDNIEQNSRVRVGDVDVGNVTKIERQGWHALVTMTLNGDVDLPANATAKIGQTSLLGSLHVELAPPTDEPPEGKLHDGSLIPLASSERISDHRADAGRGVDAAQRRRHRPDPGHHQGVEHRVHRSRERSAQPDRAARHRSSATSTTRSDDIIAATDSLNNLVGQFADQKPVLDKALKTIPDALAVLKDQREQPGRRARRSWASSARWPPTRSTRPRRIWSRSSRTSGRCWSRWPMPVPR